MTHNKAIHPPRAKVVRSEKMIHGELRVDNYAWLREKDNPEVLEYLKAENAYTDAMMQHTSSLQEELYQEMKGRIKETDLSVPEKVDDFFYYSRTEENQQYSIYCRKPCTLDSEEEILLDQNTLAAGHDYFRLGVIRVSPDHKLLAYSVDTTGDETYTLFIKDLQSGDRLPDQIKNTYYSVQWANDNRTLFYTILDAAQRPYKLLEHRLGTPVHDDAIVFHEPDDAFLVRLAKTKSRQYLVLSLTSHVTSEAWFLDANYPDDPFKLIHPRQHKVEYYVSHHEESFYVLTNEDAVNFKLMRTPVSQPGKENWQEVLPHNPRVTLEGIEVFANYLVVYERELGLPRVRIENFESGEQHHIEFEEPAFQVVPAGNPDYHSELLRFNYASLITPNTVYDYDMRSRTKELKKQQEVLGGYEPGAYVSERIFATAGDGARIPISLVYKRDFVKDGRAPALLYGYGSYGINIEPGFNSNRLSLIDRGFVYAIAHVRGSAMMGQNWYEDGKLLNKKNTFSDFIACAEYLVGQKYTCPAKLAISGASAGGMLVGAALNMRPGLFRVVVAKVPFVDIVNTMLDASLPLTVIEYDEWGNPNDREFYDYIKSYSPYDNVSPRDYPHILVTAGLNDPRVQYWEPVKWVARLRASKTDRNTLLMKTNLGAGHGGASGRYDALKEIAFDYAFTLDKIAAEE